MSSNAPTIDALLRVKHVIDGMKAIDTRQLTETEREALQECLDHAYDRAAYLLAELGEQRPRLIPVCLIVSMALALIMQRAERSSVESSSFSGEEGAAKPMFERHFLPFYSGKKRTI